MEKISGDMCVVAVPAYQDTPGEMSAETNYSPVYQVSPQKDGYLTAANNFLNDWVKPFASLTIFALNGCGGDEGGDQGEPPTNNYPCGYTTDNNGQMIPLPCSQDAGVDDTGVTDGGGTPSGPCTLDPTSTTFSMKMTDARGNYGFLVVSVGSRRVTPNADGKTWTVTGLMQSANLVQGMIPAGREGITRNEEANRAFSVPLGMLNYGCPTLQNNWGQNFPAYANTLGLGGYLSGTLDTSTCQANFNLVGAVRDINSLRPVNTAVAMAIYSMGGPNYCFGNETVQVSGPMNMFFPDLRPGNSTAPSGNYQVTLLLRPI